MCMYLAKALFGVLSFSTLLANLPQVATANDSSPRNVSQATYTTESPVPQEPRSQAVPDIAEEDTEFVSFYPRYRGFGYVGYRGPYGAFGYAYQRGPGFYRPYYYSYGFNYRPYYYPGYYQPYNSFYSFGYARPFFPRTYSFGYYGSTFPISYTSSANFNCSDHPFVPVMPPAPTILSENGVPVQPQLTPLPAPLPMPLPGGEGTFPYNGGPSAPIPAPRSDSIEGPDTHLVSTGAKANRRWIYPAYGEAPRQTTETKPSAQLTGFTVPVYLMNR